jgi:hypothetical protein
MKTDFNFISAITTKDWTFPCITFFGNSGYFYNVCIDKSREMITEGATQYIFWDGYHVATKHMNRIIYNPHANNLPKGFKAACKQI